jgi:hypothetical protein
VEVAPITPETFDLGGFCRGLISALIKAARNDPAEMKARIMIAWEHGHLTAQEAEEWIVLAGLVEA